jgi:two-component system, LytTR family, sensor kinase
VVEIGERDFGAGVSLRVFGSSGKTIKLIPMQRKYYKAALILGICTLATALYASHLYIFHLWRGDPIGRLEAVGDAASDWYAWAILAPFILHLAERFPIRRDRITRSVIFHIVAGAILSLIQIFVHTLFDQILMHHHVSIEALKKAGAAFFARTYHFGLLVYWLMVIVQNAAQYYRDQALQASQLESRLAQAQLNSLKMQLQPHFLFNTLHAISSLMHDDMKSAETMIARLSELLRASLKTGNLHEVRLSEELQVLQLCLEIVENSIRHGIGSRRGAGAIRIHAERQNGSVLLQIQDNGVGIKGDLQEGVGLSNIRGRLSQLYGRQQSMELKNIDDGFLVRLILPYHDQTTRYDV